VTTKPELRIGRHLLPGIVALALFAVMAAIVLTSSFGDYAGFGGIESVTAAIGYALFNIPAETVPTGTEGFLAAFEIIDVVLVAALVAGVMLARREVGGEVVTALRSEVDVRWGADRSEGGRQPEREGDRR
jgi:NADH-quinone oxidoreductase subunit J